MTPESYFCSRMVLKMSLFTQVVILGETTDSNYLTSLCSVNLATSTLTSHKKERNELREIRDATF